MTERETPAATEPEYRGWTPSEMVKFLRAFGHTSEAPHLIVAAEMIEAQDARIAELDRKARRLCQWIGCVLAELRVSTPEDAEKELNRRASETIVNRATIQRLNRRAQKAESELSKLRKAVPTGGSWESAERRREAKERDAGMAAVAKAEERSGR